MADSTATSRAARVGDLMAVAGVLATVAILLSWAALDASYAQGLLRTQIFLHLPVGFSISETHIAADMGILNHLREVSWNRIGTRVLGMSAVFVLGAIGSLWTLVRAIGRRDVRSGSALCLVLVAWGLYFGIHRRLDQGKAERQIRNLLPRIEAIADELHANWPKAPIVLKSGVSYFVDPEQWPHALLKRGPHDPYPYREDLGRLVYRTREGAIQFDLAASYDRMVEFHAHGTVPKDSRGITERHSTPAKSWVRLKENWYLVRY